MPLTGTSKALAVLLRKRRRTRPGLLTILFSLPTDTCYLRRERRGQGLIAGTNVPNCGGFAVVWARSRPCLSQPLLAVIHTPHTLCSDLTRGKAPASPRSSSSKIHKGKVLNDFLSLPVFTACCPHPPCLLPVRRRKSGGITAEVAAGFQGVCAGARTLVSVWRVGAGETQR